MIVGFTGTRAGMNEGQTAQLVQILSCLAATPGPREFHFGGSGKSDLAARALALASGYAIHWHPCPGVALWSLPSRLFEQAQHETWHEVFPPLVRDKNIVAIAEIVIAAPEFDDEELRSGTWATVRYGNRATKPVIHLSRGMRRYSAGYLRHHRGQLPSDVSGRRYGKRYP